MSDRRVLVVDDETKILDIVRYFLEQGGWEVETFTAGEPALEAAGKRTFQVAILDIVLDRDSGYEVAGRLKKLANCGDLPVLFVSSKIDMADLFLENFDGRAEFLPKPLKKEELLAAVQALADGGGRLAHKPTRARKK